MPIINRIAAIHNEMTAWRRDIHAHPELGFEETRTSDVVAQKLESFGIEIHRGLAKTGVVGVLKGKPGERAIALRADMDALPIHETNGFDHCSVNDGKMHACGHDGHTTMLLGAAHYLAETRNFKGTVYFVFQPAEEGLGGGEAMVKEGLFEQFPSEAVYGMHNWPGMPLGEIAVRTGPMMAACDEFEIIIEGTGAHAAMPHLGVDPIVASSQIVTALQTIVGRSVSALEAGVVSVTTIHAGDAFNVIPSSVRMTGTVRTFKPHVQEMIAASIHRIVENVATGLGTKASVKLEKRFPATVNTETETAHAEAAAATVVGADKVRRDVAPSMGSEDFAYMLQAKPGSYVWIGNGAGEGGCFLHNSGYDFNDDALPIGASYWATLVESQLPADGQ
jgi:hippurate hydrolase